MPRNEYPCKCCNAEPAFGSRYPETYEKYKKFDTCMTCADKAREKKRDEFAACLNSEQQKLFHNYEEADDFFTSMVILD